jgi:alpha-tubulin suppressor-like RCC1 family protein
VSNGKAYGAGYNNLGQLGLGDTEHRHVFTEIASLSDKNITAFDVGFYHVLALSDEGKVYGAGRNENGELGLIDTNDRTVFTAVSSLKNRNITAIAAGQAYSLALSNEGKVYAAGKSTDGSLGLGYTERSTAFTEVPSLGGKNITAITTGNFHSLALSDEGKVYTVGRNSDGQLGLGDTSVGRNVFIEISSLSGIVAIAAGSHYSLALSSEGKVYAAGRNKEGQLGLGDTNSSNTFTEVTSLSDKNVTAIAAGQSQTLILTDDGKVYVVGGNEYGQLGLGDTISRQAFTEVPNLGNITAIAAGDVHSLALSYEGKVYVTGRNANGQLGLGDTNNSNTFTEVTVP